MGFYTKEELNEIGFKSIGKNVFISNKTSIYGAKNISIGNNVRIDDFVVLSGVGGYINIGNYVHLAVFSVFFGGAGIEIEDFTTTSSRVALYSVSDDYSGQTLTNPMIPEEYKKIEYKKVVLKRHTIVGTGSIILPGVILAEGTAIGANSLLLKSTEPWGIYAGNPAKRIKERKRDLLELEQKFLKEVENTNL